MLVLRQGTFTPLVHARAGRTLDVLAQKLLHVVAAKRGQPFEPNHGKEALRRLGTPLKQGLIPIL